MRPSRGDFFIVPILYCSISAALRSWNSKALATPPIKLTDKSFLWYGAILRRKKERKFSVLFWIRVNGGKTHLSATVVPRKFLQNSLNVGLSKKVWSLYRAKTPQANSPKPLWGIENWLFPVLIWLPCHNRHHVVERQEYLF